MNVPLWARDLARAFWAQAGLDEPFPRSLRRAVPLAVPLNIDDVPNLTLRKALEWLAEQGLDWPVAPDDQFLHGVLFACRGQGFALVEANDTPAERRFTLAHELAHFLRHYLHPRDRAVHLLGEGALEVLDGDRGPSLSERLHSVLHKVPVGHHTHLLARTCKEEKRARAEEEADLLACELLAPRDAVLADFGGDLGALTSRLTQEYGLPRRQAVAHAVRLLGLPEARHPLVEGLRTAGHHSGR